MTDDKRQIKTLTPPKYVNYHNVFIADEHTSAYILFVITRNRSIFDQKIFCHASTLCGTNYIIVAQREHDILDTIYNVYI